MCGGMIDADREGRRGKGVGKKRAKGQNIEKIAFSRVRVEKSREGAIRDFKKRIQMCYVYIPTSHNKCNHCILQTRANKKR